MKLIRFIPFSLLRRKSGGKTPPAKSKENNSLSVSVNRVCMGNAREIVRGGPPGYPEQTFAKALPRE